jgi:hypothetical protein
VPRCKATDRSVKAHDDSVVVELVHFALRAVESVSLDR